MEMQDVVFWDLIVVASTESKFKICFLVYLLMH